MKGYIYKITNNINGKAYIGQTIYPHNRWREHQYQVRMNQCGCPLLYKAIRKYGISNFSFTIIKECLLDEMNDREQYFIKACNSFGAGGYNCNEGGEGQRGFHHSAYTKQLIGNKSRQRSPECNRKIAEKLRGRPIPPERLKILRKQIKKAHQAACEWHKSPEGLEWHRKLAEKNKGKCFMKYYDHKCENCGTSYVTRKQHSRFCSGRCEQKWRRDNKVNIVIHQCMWCGKPIEVDKYAQHRRRFCDTHCASKFTHLYKKFTNIPEAKIKSIEFCGYEDVYNMEVQDTHNFSVSNGLIVHNCLDAMRYACHKLGQANFSF